MALNIISAVYCVVAVISLGLLHKFSECVARLTKRFFPFVAELQAAPSHRPSTSTSICAISSLKCTSFAMPIPVYWVIACYGPWSLKIQPRKSMHKQAIVFSWLMDDKLPLLNWVGRAGSVLLSSLGCIMGCITWLCVGVHCERVVCIALCSIA